MEECLRVLIITIPFDVHAAAIEWSFRKRGHHVDVIFSSDFPSKTRMSISIEGDCKSSTLLEHEGNIYGPHYDLVWRRRASAPRIMAEDPVSEFDLKYARSLALRTHFEFLTNAFAEAAWINYEAPATKVNDSKIYQLQNAASVGFTIPKTLISNSPQAIKKFIKNQKSIIKAFHQHRWHADRKNFGVQTTIINETLLEDHNSVHFSPSIFQPFIEKKYEIRVTWLGDRYKAVRIDALSDEAKIDWRPAANHGQIAIKEYILPESLRAKCAAFMKKVGLTFGCLDIIAAKDNDYVFLEVNEMGNFLWKETMCPDLKMLDFFVTGCEDIANCKSNKRYSVKWEDYSNANDEFSFGERSENVRPLAKRNTSFEIPTDIEAPH